MFLSFMSFKHYLGNKLILMKNFFKLRGDPGVPLKAQTFPKKNQPLRMILRVLGAGSVTQESGAQGGMPSFM